MDFFRGQSEYTEGTPLQAADVTREHKIEYLLSHVGHNTKKR